MVSRETKTSQAAGSGRPCPRGPTLAASSEVTSQVRSATARGISPRAIGTVWSRVGTLAIALATAITLLGHDARDAEAVSYTPCPAAQSHRYLTEGSTKFGFDEWILLANPSVTETAIACITYMTSSGPLNGGTVNLAPQTRKSLNANSKVTSSQVSVDVAVIAGTLEAERSMSNSSPGLAGANVGGSVNNPGHDWFMAEGVTAGGSETWVLVANPSATETAAVTVDFMTSKGRVAGPAFALNPRTRKSIRVGQFTSTYDVSSRVHSVGAAVIAERATYLAHGGFRGSTDSPAVQLGSTSALLAEGATAGGFKTWILIANPAADATATVSLTYLTGNGPVAGPRIALAPQSRRSILVNDTVATFDVSTLVESDIAVVAERAMYSNDVTHGKGSATGEASSEGGKHWLAVEGATASGFETWVLVANPDPALTATIAVTFLTASGPVAGPTLDIGPASRRSIRVDNSITTFDVATDVSVISGPSVYVDRTVYTPPGPAHDMTGGPAARLTASSPVADPVILAVGDIACDPNSGNFNGGLGSGLTCRQMATSDLALNENATAFLALGDLQYETGAASAFAASYDPSWGRLKAITHPVAGNHEYGVAGAAPYFDYFGALAGAPGAGWYSHDIGRWHLIALNSNCAQVGGCNAGSPQEQWLRSDLAAHANSCTLAYWHHPRFSSGSHNNDVSVDALWRALYENHADLILNGHDHEYERFAPQTPDAVADPSGGIRQFVVGTGGKNVGTFSGANPNSESRISDSLGLLKLTLMPDAYAWEFKPAVGTSTDSGAEACR